MDGCGINNKVGSRKNVFCLLTVENLCAKRSQVAGQVTFFCIGTGNCKSFLLKNLGKAAHADAADANKMYMDWFAEIYFVHGISFNVSFH